MEFYRLYATISLYTFIFRAGTRVLRNFNATERSVKKIFDQTKILAFCFVEIFYIYRERSIKVLSLATAYSP